MVAWDGQQWVDSRYLEVKLIEFGRERCRAEREEVVQGNPELRAHQQPCLTPLSPEHFPSSLSQALSIC